MRGLLAPLAWIGVSFVPAVIGAPFPSSEWYETLQRPGWAPPGWLFAPVWTVLYLLMGIAAWLVARGGIGRARLALGLWGAQLVLNAIWTPIFFGLRDLALAVAVICLLWVVVLATAVAFSRHSRLASALLLPYLGWITFAAALNFEIWRLN